MDTQTRAFSNITLRSTADSDGHTVEGIAVPFNQIIEYDGVKEQFDRNTVFDGLDNAKLCYQHGELIGHIIRAESRDEGLHITARIADTTTGRDVIALLDNGALDSFSVGFVPTKIRRNNNVVCYEQVRLLETSIVSWPAYSHAKITDHRSASSTAPTKEKTMTPEELDQLKADNLQRGQQLDQLNDTLRKIQAKMDMPQVEQSNELARWTSFGDFVRAIAHDEDHARDTYMRLVARSQSADSAAFFANTSSAPQWVKDHITLVQSTRTISNLVSHEALPADGMTLQYNVMGDDTTSVNKFNEGDDLTFGKITLKTRTASVETFGGYTEISRATIDRSSTPYLDTLMRAMTIAYAKYTEKATRTILYGAIQSSKNATDPGNDIANLTAADWISLVIDASETLDELGATNITLGVSKDVFKAMAALSMADRPLMDVSGQGVQQLGSLDLTGITGNLLRYAVRLLPGAPTGTAAFFSKDAVTMWEESNAPFALTQDRAKDLGREISLYGYAAHGVTNVNGILTIKHAQH